MQPAIKKSLDSWLPEGFSLFKGEEATQCRSIVLLLQNNEKTATKQTDISLMRMYEIINPDKYAC